MSVADTFRANAEKTGFPYIVFDNIVKPQIMLDAVTTFPEPGQDGPWKSYRNRKYEFGKHQLMDLSGCHPHIQRVQSMLCGQQWLAMLRSLSGIENLQADPSNRGGGLHSSETGGFLQVHYDFNRHKQQKNLFRRLNVIVFCVPQWEERWGGELVLCRIDDPDTIVERVFPALGRVVVFETMQGSWHGHPWPLRCPKGVYRQSFASYYYSPDQGGQRTEAHSTQWHPIS